MDKNKKLWCMHVMMVGFNENFDIHVFILVYNSIQTTFVWFINIRLTCICIWEKRTFETTTKKQKIQVSNRVKMK